MKVLIKLWYLLLFLLLVSLLAYDDIRILEDENIFTLDKYLENPGKYGGAKSQRMGKILEINGDYFFFSGGDKAIKVIGKIERPVLGETLIYVHYRKDGVIELIDYHNYNFNYILYILSLFAIMIFLVVFFREWKLTKRGFKDA